ncbi:MOSC domain-containing protein [Cyanobium sp. Morenito 9A2]|uniref:MOSC domain-containing protein n=1 Tax=Cyanobium sp. Morenito 9A2 TaxID=2823718 RepID=UPI0020CF9D83|nr:MOSC domain-containing protein [Cyanobium sp. Morenito 9A2]MCP9850989.1 MOSC domain-containing protein [Cyanobium sp. Morenito 9A2]
MNPITRQRVGTLTALWRYPVKSMGGQAVETSTVNERGLLGDRSYALLDVRSGNVASAKNPRPWAPLLGFEASYVTSPEVDGALPPVAIRTPEGHTLPSDGAETNQHLSAALGREVTLISTPPEAARIEHYWPTVEGIARREVVTGITLPAGTFFDACSLHAITTATLARLQELHPAGAYDGRRFRPNLVIDTGPAAHGFLEKAWVGSTLAIGDSVRLQVTSPCTRCVMTTLAQPGLPQDLDILRTTARHNNVIAGVRLAVLRGGRLHLGDPVWLEAEGS